LELLVFTAEPQGVNMVALKPLIHNNKGKAKAIPEQVWTGPEVFRRLRLPDFMKFATRRW
jgi:hypothetical protein